jgi:hypothetical protein
MSIAEMQACLARLYLSDAYRHWFYADPAKALASYRLEAAERTALAELRHDQLELFASSLVAKRRKGAEGAYPASFTLDGPAMRRLHYRYHQLFPPRSGQSPPDDAIAFGKFAEASLAEDEQVVQYAGDLIRYERLYYRACIESSPGPAVAAAGRPGSLSMESRPVRRTRVELAHFDHDVGVVEDGLRRGEPPPDAAAVRDACSILFVPGRNGREARMLRVNAATVVVVERCDGQRTVADVIVDTETAVGVGSLCDPIVRTIARLVAADVLVVDHSEQDEPARPVYTVATQSEAM